MCIVSLHTALPSSEQQSIPMVNNSSSESSGCIRYPFIMLANRDEEYDRPTSSSFSLIDDCICCITDLVYGNTWMGINVENGNFAILTNVDDDYTMNRPTLELYNNNNGNTNHHHHHHHHHHYHHQSESNNNSSCSSLQSSSLIMVKKDSCATKQPAKVIRSKLLIDLLKHIDLNDHIREYEKDWLKTKGFIIICGNLFETTDHNHDESTLIYFTNRVFNRNEMGKPLSQWPDKLSDKLIIQSLEKNSTHCISNSFLNDELWQKVKVLKEGTHQLCNQKDIHEKTPDELVGMLSGLLNIRNIHQYENNFISINDSHLFTDEFMKHHNFCEELVDLVHKYRECTNSTERYNLERKIDVHLYDRSTINEVFVHYKSKFTNWKSKSQSIVIVDAIDRKVYFYFRDVNEYSSMDEQVNQQLKWSCKEIDFKNK